VIQSPITRVAVRDAAKSLDRTPQRVRQLLAEGRLDFRRTPYGRLIDPDSLERFLEERRQVEELRARG
jgi:hypothetical protein